MVSDLGGADAQEIRKTSDAAPRKLVLPSEDFDPFHPGCGLSSLVDSLFGILRQKTEHNTLPHRFVDKMHDSLKDVEGTEDYCDSVGQLFECFEDDDVINDTDVHASFQIRHTLLAAFRYRFEAAGLISRFQLIYDEGLFPTPDEFHSCVGHLMSLKGGSLFLAAIIIEFSKPRRKDLKPPADVVDWLDKSVFNALKQDANDYGIIWRPAYGLLLKELHKYRREIDEECDDYDMWANMHNMCASYESLKARLRSHVAEWLPLRVLQASKLPLEIQFMVQDHMRNTDLAVRFNECREIECYSCENCHDWHCGCYESDCAQNTPPHWGCQTCDRSVWMSKAEWEERKQAEREAEWETESEAESEA